MTAATQAGIATVAGHQVATDHWIGGERVASANRFDVISPIDGVGDCRRRRRRRR